MRKTRSHLAAARRVLAAAERVAFARVQVEALGREFPRTPVSGLPRGVRGPARRLFAELGAAERELSRAREALVREVRARWRREHGPALARLDSYRRHLRRLEHAK
jgi:hypothetical protein